MDVLTGIYEVKAKYHCQDNRIFMVGSSLGGYLVQMVRKFAPKSLAWIFEISGQACLEPNFFLRRHIFSGIYDTQNTIVGIMNDNIYSDDPEHQFYYSPDKACIRSHLEEEHYQQAPADGQAITIITGSEDTAVTLNKKTEQVDLLRRAGAEVQFQFHIIRPEDVDGKLIKHAGHSLGADFYNLICTIGERPLLEIRNAGPSDFEQGSTYAYTTPGGVYKVDYCNGLPKMSFEPR